MLGALLGGQGKLAPEALEQALKQQARSRDRLGDILVASGSISYHALYAALAQQQELPFADLLKHPPEGELLELAHARNYLRLGVMPWKREEGRVIVALSDMSEEALAWARAHYGENAGYVITSPLDIRRTVEAHLGGELEGLSRFYLWRHFPHISAHTLFAPWHGGVLCGLVLVLAFAMSQLPVEMFLTLLFICHLLYTLTIGLKYIIFRKGVAAPTQGFGWPQKLATLEESELPVYTVIIPMYRESESVASMLEAMQALDYPPARLDIKMVLEEDDEETYRAAVALRPRYQFEIIRVPAGEPRTKPRACNYALHFARGEYVAIFDADDRPERTQLKKAVYAFRNAPRHVAFLQSRLVYYNTGDNLLTRFFALEYHSLFYVLLRGLERLRIPLPLGGTSNHISLAHIRELGGWDPYNVTEDADLGVRLSTHGYITQMLDSYTLEEAPNRMGAWLRQRSRWIKGYMQTWVVYMRKPRELYQSLGVRGFFGFQCFIGLPCFSFLSAPLLWVVTILWALRLPPFAHAALPGWLLALTVANLLLSLLSHWYFAFYCAKPYRNRVSGMEQAAALYPFYLILHSLASYKALWQLIFRPHFWEKTHHGRAISCANPLQNGEDAY